jgi:transposase-like protein
MELLRLKCPVCHSADIQYHSPYTTKNHCGRVIYKCDHCPVYFSETKNTLMEGLNTPVSVIWQVIKARTEGMGLNAAARTFDKSKNTIRYCWRTPKCRIVCVPHAFFEGKNAEGTDTRKSTSRTWKEVGQQYPILAWESKFSDLHQVLFLYAVVHEFLEQPC